MGLSAYIDEPLLYPTDMLEEVARERRETALRIKFHLMLLRSQRADESERRNPIKVVFSWPEKTSSCANFLFKRRPMSIITRFFSKSAVITSNMIQAEIERAEGEIVMLHSKLAAARSGIMLLNDSEHQAVEQSIAATKRAIDRLDARIALLNDQLPVVLAAEEAAAKAEADAALCARAEECRKANEKEAAKLLKEYDVHATAIGDIIAKLKAMDTERAEINAALKSNPVCEPARSYVDIHRTIPGTEATEQRAKVPCWVYRYPGSPSDTGDVKYQFEAPREEVRRAAIGPDGEPVRGATEIHNYYGREIIITPTLEKREMVVSRTRAQPPRYEHPLDDVRMPPGLRGGKWHWPRS